jgi:endothelin-converting enzyme/putative endopeptidase
MRFLKILLLVLSCSGFKFGQATETGIEVGDIDKAADPCTDFFQYSNGKWRAENPIPPSQVRWSRRWQAGEAAKDQLKLILDDVSLKADWPRGSVEELIGDYYGSIGDKSLSKPLNE